MKAISRIGGAAALLLAILAVGGPVAGAKADGDPGSDVLVYQNLFVGSDAGLSIPQQAQLAARLSAAARAGRPIRVAIIAGQADLGAITALWGKPRTYARFLGQELSLGYRGRLLIVMPDGFGLNWPGHSVTKDYSRLAGIHIRSGGTGLLGAAQAAVSALAGNPGGAAAGPVTGGGPATGSAASASGSSAPAPVKSGQRTDTLVALLTFAFVALVAALLLGRRALGGRLSGLELSHRWRERAPRLLPAAGVATVLAAAGAAVAFTGLDSSPSANASPAQALANNPYLDPGTPLSGPAPEFTLNDQFGRRVSLRSFRGKVVILAFTDSECTTVCPLTTTAMLDAKAMLGRAASSVQLLGVDANPAATSLEDVLSYSQLHGMLHSWDFLTGSLAQLRRVWKAYAIQADIQRGLIAHTPALMVIAPDGWRARVYMTQQSYAAVGQLGQILAHEASSLLPGHPRVHSSLSYARVPAVSPTTRVSLPGAGGGSVTLGPGRAHLSLFFATWDQAITSLAGRLSTLDRYSTAAARDGLPRLTAVDEGSVEPSPSALPAFLAQLPRPLSYPVAVDRSGRVADGYEVQGEPWFVLTSPTGRILWYWQVSTSGWLSESALIAHVRAALARTGQATSNSALAIQHALAGSPAPLALLHQQADRLLGSEPALAARVRSLRGYPIVINAWASWCAPCRSEFGLFAAASARFGRRVAFIGADTNDSAGDAQSFLDQHPVGYPSYQTTTSDLNPFAVIQGLPTTIFLNARGRVVYVHTGQYEAEGSLAEDIQAYASGR